MTLASNPYESVDIDAIPIERIGEQGSNVLYYIKTSEVKPFDACVFRQNLTDFLFDNARDEWYLGNDGLHGDHNPNDLMLALSVMDMKKFEAYGWLVIRS